MSYDRWKTRSPDDGVYHAGDEKPDPASERADYEDRMAQLCIACANGNDLPEGETCSLCHRVGPAIHDHGLRLRDVSNAEVRAAIARECCKACGGSGFSGSGTGYGDVCGECGGLG